MYLHCFLVFLCLGGKKIRKLVLDQAIEAFFQDQNASIDDSMGLGSLLGLVLVSFLLKYGSPYFFQMKHRYLIMKTENVLTAR